jgi:hypothetical protein
LFSFIPESLRWLVSKGRLDEAFKTLKKVSEINKTNLNEDTWKDFLGEEAVCCHIYTEKKNKKAWTIFVLILAVK